MRFEVSQFFFSLVSMIHDIREFFLKQSKEIRNDVVTDEVEDEVEIVEPPKKKFKFSEFSRTENTLECYFVKLEPKRYLISKRITKNRTFFFFEKNQKTSTLPCNSCSVKPNIRNI